MKKAVLLGMIFVISFGSVSNVVFAEEIPAWVKNNAGLWAENIITDSDFINSIQYLISNGIIVIVEEKTQEETVQVTLSGNFVDGDFFHKTSGSAKITFEENMTLLHISEDFDTLSGPDLYVYLATDKHAKDFVDLGRLQSFSGEQSYEVSSDIDFEKYDEVLIWCKAFGVLFGNAKLHP